MQNQLDAAVAVAPLVSHGGGGNTHVPSVHRSTPSTTASPLQRTFDVEFKVGNSRALIALAHLSTHVLRNQWPRVIDKPVFHGS